MSQPKRNVTAQAQCHSPAEQQNSVTATEKTKTTSVFNLTQEIGTYGDGEQIILQVNISYEFPIHKTHANSFSLSTKKK